MRNSVSLRTVVGLSLSLALVVTAGCAGKAINENDPASLYEGAESNIKDDQYLIALEKLRVIRNKFPYSKYAVLAQLRIADVYFLQESFGEAAAAYETFRDLHPKHEKVDYAMFRTAKSYYLDMPDPVARDMTPAQKAENAYNSFLTKFSMSPNAAEARKDLIDVRGKLAEKEIYIANYYFGQAKFESARGRYQKIVDAYSDTKYAEEAKQKLEKAKKLSSEAKAKQEKN
ncbi:outer membrane protein assembly factor BamD [bacterium]|nr:outer membrane protein assembly factor BamD [bacterium]